MYSTGNISTSHHDRGIDEEKHAIRKKGRENRKKEKDHASMQHAKITNISFEIIYFHLNGQNNELNLKNINLVLIY